MKRPMATSMVLTLGFCVLVGVSAKWAEAQGAKTAVVWPAAEIRWSDNPAVTGAKSAVLWGDPKTGAYGALRKIPGGTTLALHTHTRDTRVLVLSGTVLLSINGDASKALGPGSYGFIEGGVKHMAECKVGAECTYFEEQPGPSDIKFVEGSAPER